MKKVIFSMAVALPLFTSCAKKTVYVYKGTEKVSINDTLRLPCIHHHEVVDSMPRCMWIQSIEIPYNDTLEFEVWEKRTKYRLR